MSTTSRQKQLELKEAKDKRAESYALKDQRILALVAEGRSRKDISETLKVCRKYIQKVVDRAEAKS